MLSIRLDKETEERLNALSEKTERPKSYYVKKAIKEFLEDREDYLLAVAALEESEGFLTVEEVRSSLGLESNNRKKGSKKIKNNR